jgi:Domain of unknown function (DUF4340)
MTYHARLNLIMLATIVGIVIFLYIRPQSDEAQTYRISSLSPEAAQSIQILHKDNRIVLEKLKNRWHLTEPINARADEEKVTQLLEILTAKSEHRFPLTDLARFNLDAPNVQLFINRESFDFGGLTPITNQQYVATEDNVFLISPRYAVMLQLQPSEIVSPAPLAETETPVSFQLDDISIEKHERQWLVSSENSEQLLSQEKIVHWVQLWQQAAASSLMLGSEVLQVDEMPVVQKEINIRLQNGQKIKFNALETGSGLILTRSDEEIRYVFSANAGKSLIDPYFVSQASILPED